MNESEYQALMLEINARDSRDTAVVPPSESEIEAMYEAMDCKYGACQVTWKPSKQVA